MTKVKKVFGVAFAALFTLFTFFSYAPAQAAGNTKTPIIPQVQFLSTPTTEYTVGDRVRFDISTPNYGKKVEYRVVLWNNSTKSYSDLWNVSNGYPNRYYTKWQPWGNNVFTLGWPILEPGSYRITVYVKRVGVANNKAYLKGMNCDSYKESVAFTVKPSMSVLDKDGQTYGSNDASKPLVIKNDVNITAKNVIFNNANVEGNINITGDNAALNNITATGKIFVDPGKDGSTTLENVTAKAIEVLSGGTNSIHIKNVKSDSLVVNSTNPVRIETDGDTEIVSTTANGYVIFDKKSGTFGTITITKDESGETVVEFRGDIQDKVVVETQATITTTEGSKLENLVIATESTTDKVVLQGAFSKVEVSKPASVEIAKGTTVTNVDVKANAQVAVANGATVQTLDTNNNTVTLDNQGTITKQENTGGTSTVPSPGGSTGGGTPIPGDNDTTVTNENTLLNQAINNVIHNFKNYSLFNNMFTTVSSVPSSGRSNTITLVYNPTIKDMDANTIVGLANARFQAHDPSDTRDLATKIAIVSLLGNVQVNNSNGYNQSAILKLNELYDGIKTNPANYDTYDEIAVTIHALLPGDDVTLNSVTSYNLEIQTIAIGSSPIYNISNVGVVDKKITLSEIRTALVPAGTETKNLSLDKLVNKNITITLKGNSGTLYTYTIIFQQG